MKVEWKTFLEDAGAEFNNDTVIHFGNPVREMKVALGGTVFADLGYMGVISVYGEDAGNFLQSQLSNDIGQIDAGNSQLNAFCIPKGRILGLMRIFKSGETFYLRLPLDSLEAVLQRLRMYVMRADVTLEDVTENFLRMGISGGDAVSELEEAVGIVPEAVNAVIHKGDITLIRVPGIQPRFEIFVSALQSAQSLWDALNVRAAPVGEPDWRLLEIQAGIPTVFAATAELFVPQMLNLQLIDGLNFNKGCYPGQEIVARMQYLGTLKRRMYIGHIAQDEAVVPGDELFSGADSEQVAGRIIDAQAHPDGGQLALAILQIKTADAGDIHLGAANGPAFTLQALPYPFEQQDSGQASPDN